MPALPVMANKKRNGKVAHLEYEKRDVINRMLRDGAMYVEILAWLATVGVEGMNDQNLINWKDGGYQDWLAEQERFEDMKFKREFALQLVKENEGSVVHEAGLQVAASQIYELLTDFDVETLKASLKGDPENYSRIVNAMSKLSETGLKYDRYKAEVAAVKARIAKEIEAGKGKGGITAETLQKIESELRLL